MAQQAQSSSYLPPLLLKEVALKSGDPSSWACVCSATHSALDAAFELDWFLSWHHVLLPHRSWQYAVLTWRRMQGQPPRRVAEFMLCVLHAKQQEQEQQQQQDAGSQQQQQQPAAQDAPAAAAAAPRKPTWSISKYEGKHMGRFPDLQPLPSVLRKVHKLLAQNCAAADLQALLLLCPHQTFLLCQYAARDLTAPNPAALRVHRDVRRTNTSSSSSSSSSSAEAMPLLQRLMQHMSARAGDRLELAHLWKFNAFAGSKVFGRFVQTHRLGCFAALAAGNVPQLLELLQAFTPDTMGGTTKQVLLRLLLPYAVRHSNAAGVRAVLMQHAPADRRTVLAPQHMALAAGRSDPWAAGVVSLLLHLLSPKQLKPTHMRAAYRCACAVGYPPVLRLLLKHAVDGAQQQLVSQQPPRPAAAAAATKQHVLVLLDAAVTSGNRLVCELLLGDTHAALQEMQQLHGQPPAQPAEEESQQRHVQLLRDAWRALSYDQQLQLIDKAIPIAQHYLPASTQRMTHVATLLRAAGLLLLQLPQATQVNILNSLGSVLADTDTNVLPVTYATGDWQPAVLEWGLQHGRLQHVAHAQLLRGMLQAAKTGALQSGVSWGQGLTSGGHPQQSPEQAGSDSAEDDETPTLSKAKGQYVTLEVCLAVLQGRLAAACAACDAAAVEQLEHLYQLCFMLLTPPPSSSSSSAPYRPATTASVAPTLPVSPVQGRAVTVAHLSAALGLPWPLLATLMQAANYHKLPSTLVDAAEPMDVGGCGRSAGRTADSSASSSSSISTSTAIQQLIDDAKFAVDYPQSAEEAGVLVTPEPYPLVTLAVAVAEGDDNGLQLAVPHASVQQAAALRLYLLLPRRLDRGDQTEAAVAAMLVDDPQLERQLRSAHQHDMERLTSQAEQTGPPPLWMQALLQVVAPHAQQQTLYRCGPYTVYDRHAAMKAGVFDRVSLWQVGGEQMLLQGLEAGRTVQEVHQFVSRRLLQPPRAPNGPPLPAHAPWGFGLLQRAMSLQLPQMVAWLLLPQHQQELWGTAHTAVSEAVMELSVHGCSPINCAQLFDEYHNSRVLTAASEVSASSPRATSHHAWPVQVQQWQQQQRDLTDMRQQREQLLGSSVDINTSSNSSGSGGPMVAAAGPLPQFASSAVQMAMMLLQHPDAAEHTLNRWLQRTVRVGCALPDLVRARAIVAAVAAAAVVPPGARVFEKEALRQVLAVGDPDLFALVVSWCERLPLEISDEEAEFGVPLGVLEDDDWGEAVAELAAGVDAQNI